MRFRPCIDIHNGQVKQIVGGSLTDVGDQARENFVSKQDAAFFAKLYEKHELKGGHVILLNGKDSSYYEATKSQAIMALKAYPKGMQIGGGINDENAYEFLEMGAQKIIVTSYVFKNGQISLRGNYSKDYPASSLLQRLSHACQFHNILCKLLLLSFLHTSFLVATSFWFFP